LCDYTTSIAAIVKSRAVLYQIIPQLSFFTSLSTFTADAPIFIVTKNLNDRLLPMVYSYERAREEVIDDFGNEKMDKYQWVIACNCICKILHDSRLYKWLYGIYQFIVAVGILATRGNSLNLLMISTIIVIMLQSLFYSLLFVALVGKALDITDEDIATMSIQGPPLPPLPPPPSAIPLPPAPAVTIVNSTVVQNVLQTPQAPSPTPTLQAASQPPRQQSVAIAETEVFSSVNPMMERRVSSPSVNNNISRRDSASFMGGASVSPPPLPRSRMSSISASSILSSVLPPPLPRIPPPSAPPPFRATAARTSLRLQSPLSADEARARMESVDL